MSFRHCSCRMSSVYASCRALTADGLGGLQGKVRQRESGKIGGGIKTSPIAVPPITRKSLILNVIGAERERGRRIFISMALLLRRCQSRKNSLDEDSSVVVSMLF